VEEHRVARFDGDVADVVEPDDVAGPRPAASTSQPRVTICGTVSMPSRVTPAGVESASVKPS
jgi:hypothetical protein